MNIEDRAHEILLKLIDVRELHKVKTKESACIIAQNVWNVAEAMQAEAEKRKPKFECDAYGFPVRPLPSDDFEVDWSQAPLWANAWHYWSDGTATWYNCYKDHYKNCIAPTFNYSGDWKDSLRKRPDAL